MTRLAIIGGGFMGGALAEGLLDSGWHREDLVVAEVNKARRYFLSDGLNVPTAESAAEAVEAGETVLFAVKPQDIRQTLSEVAGVYKSSQLAISICAGVRIATYEDALGNPPVIRSMPNMPAAIGLGATAIARGRHASDEHLAQALNILSTVGKVVIVDERQLDAVTAVSGTGPAYLFYLAEALIDAAQREGLGREQAYVLVYQTFIGAAQLLHHDPADPAELRRRVTSEGGTTHAAVTYLDEQGWAEIFKEAVRRARVRSEELSS